MKELLGKFAKGALALALVLALAVPIQARALEAALAPDIPFSFDFEAEYRLELDLRGALPAELRPALDFVGDSLAMNTRGTVVADGPVNSLYMELDLSIAQFRLSAPVRLWLEVDISDLSSPTAIAIAELPASLQLMLMLSGAPPELIRQFYVLDFGVFIARWAEEVDARIVAISPGELEELFEYMLDGLALAAEDLDFARLLERMGIDIREFSHDFAAGDDGYSAGLSLDVTITRGDFTLDLGLAFDGALTNINAAERVAPPAVTADNSIRLLA